MRILLCLMGAVLCAAGSSCARQPDPPPFRTAATIEQIIHELSDALIGRRPGKIFPLSRFSMAIDFRLSDSRYLFISIEPADPRTYLIRRRLRDIEKGSVNPTPFVMLLKKRFS